jgi:hypothetical protein
MSSKKFRSVTLEMRNIERLIELGRMPLSFNDVVGQLLDEHEQTLKTKGVWSPTKSHPTTRYATLKTSAATESTATGEPSANEEY